MIDPVTVQGQATADDAAEYNPIKHVIFSFDEFPIQTSPSLDNRGEYNHRW